MNWQKLIHLLLLAAFSFTVNAQPDKYECSVKKGVADLRNVNLESSICFLDGEWEFFPNKFISPDKTFTDSGQMITVPMLWNRTDIEAVKNGVGFGSYRITIRVPKEEKILALRLKRIETAYRLYFNDSLITSVGRPGSSKENMQPAKENHFIFLPVKGKDFSLTLHVSNFYHRKGGIVSRPEIGRPEIVTRSVWRARGLEMFLLGAILIMAFYHGGLYFFRKEDRSALYFALFLLVVGAHLMVNGEVFFTEIFNQYSWELLLKIDFISNYLTIVFFFLFFRSLNTGMYKRPVIFLIVFGFLVLTLITLLTKALFFTKLILVFEILGALAGAYVLTVLFIAFFKRKPGAAYPLIGTLIMVAAGVNDVLHEQMIIHTFYALPLGIVGFIFFQSHILNLNFKQREDETDEINRLTSRMDDLKTKFLSKSSFDFAYPLSIMAEEFDADYAVVFENTAEIPIPVGVYPDNEVRTESSSLALKMAVECRMAGKPIVKSAKDSYSGKPCMAYPFADKEQLRFIFYMEKYQTISAENLRIIDLLTEQMLGLAQNFKLYAELKDLSSRLEEIIEERTREVRDQREDLEQQRDEIEQQTENLQRIYAELSEKNKSITDDIRYARKIHSALFRSWRKLPDIFPSHFVFFRPKEIIGGDFYWATQVGDQRLFCAADCTGHGVPGALMSIIGQNLLNRAVHELGLLQPHEILNSLQEGIRRVLSQDKGSESKDGMDLSLINYNTATGKLSFSGARNSGYIVRKGEVLELKADKMSIGGVAHARIKKDRNFSMKEFTPEKGDMLYLMSDGFIDQIGGNHQRKYMRSRMKNLFIETAELPLVKQKSRFKQELDNWRGNIEQMDDVLVAGFRF